MRAITGCLMAMLIGVGGLAEARQRAPEQRMRVEVPAQSVMFDQGRPFDRHDRAKTSLTVVADADGRKRYYRMVDPKDPTYCDKPQPWVQNGGTAQASRVRADARVKAEACHTPGPPYGAYDDRGQWHPFKR
ncbi:hypothetical protein [Arenimonas sp.]|uniref:hypothetical protein n=1 Tax=Arenimonas sp. TaxID=1872635 RepID=UPI0039E64BA1